MLYRPPEHSEQTLAVVLDTSQPHFVATLLQPGERSLQDAVDEDLFQVDLAQTVQRPAFEDEGTQALGGVAIELPVAVPEQAPCEVPLGFAVELAAVVAEREVDRIPDGVQLVGGHCRACGDDFESLIEVHHHHFGLGWSRGFG